MNEQFLEQQPGVGREAAKGLLLLIAVFMVGILGAAAFLTRAAVPATSLYLVISTGMFVIGAIGVLIRRNPLVLFMCIELMLNAVNLAFVAFSRMHQNMDGQVAVLFVIVVAAAEVAVGLAIIVSIFRRRGSATIDDLAELKW